MNNLLSNIIDFLTVHSLTDKSPYLVAFSGGADSMCLLHALKSVSSNRIIAVHLNHNWRGEESDNEETNCRIFCEKTGVEFYSEKLSSDVPKTETAARDARYQFFLNCAEKFNSEVIFTAHNANDNAETVLYRIVKGTGIDGLSGIAEVRAPFYRPLIKISREEIEDYCKNNNLRPNIDSSNFDTNYNRNFIRQEIIPKLQKINPKVICAINSLSELACEDSIILNGLTKEAGCNTSEFVNSSDGIKSRVIKQLLVDNDIDYNRKKLTLITKFIEENSVSKSGKIYSLSDKLFLYVNDRYFKVICSVNKDNSAFVHITTEGAYSFDNGILIIEKCCRIPDVYPDNNEKIIYVNSDKIDYTLRTRRDGDFIMPLGLNGSQKLKKYLNEKKIPNYKKDNIPLLCSKNEVLWVIGLGISDKIKVTDTVSHVIKYIDRSENHE